MFGKPSGAAFNFGNTSTPTNTPASSTTNPLGQSNPLNNNSINIGTSTPSPSVGLFSNSSNNQQNGDYSGELLMDNKVPDYLEIMPQLNKIATYLATPLPHNRMEVCSETQTLRNKVEVYLVTSHNSKQVVYLAHLLQQPIM